VSIHLAIFLARLRAPAELTRPKDPSVFLTSRSTLRGLFALRSSKLRIGLSMCLLKYTLELHGRPIDVVVHDDRVRDGFGTADFLFT
jgi:hypothetical protein